MSKIRVNKSIFIGLGGTGTLSIKYAKAKVLKQYGEIPPMIRFLAFDTDEAAYEPLEFEGEEIRLAEDEFSWLKVPDALKVIQEYPDLTSFFPEKNLKSASAVTKGAGQIRSLGRLAMMANFSNVDGLVSAAAGHVKGFKASLDPKYDVNLGGMGVYFCFSVAGGTGSGTFIDMAYVIKKALDLGPADSTVAFIVMPDVFKSMGHPIAVKNVEPNAYGALKEIEYLFDRKLEGTEIQYGGTKRTFVDADPFNVITIVNKMNSVGTEYNSIEQLAELVGSALWLNTGEIGRGVNSIWVNMIPHIAAQGSVKGKRARYVGVGYSEAVYNGTLLRKLYSNKAAKGIVSQLLADDTAESTKLDTYLDAWKIREDNNNDQVINALLKNTLPMEPENVEKFEAGAGSELDTKAKNFIRGLRGRAEKEAESNLKVLLGKTEVIDKYLNDLLDSGHGVGTAKSVLVALLGKLNSYNKMMAEERDKFIQSQENLAKEYKLKLSGLGDAEKSFVLGRKGKIEQACNEYLEVAKKDGEITLEIIRRQRAITFFSALISHFEERQREISGLYDTLKDGLLTEYNTEIDKISGRKGGIRPFVIDLHNKFIELIKLDGLSFMSDFLKLESKDVVSTWGKKKREEYKRLIDDFTMSLPEAQRYADWTLDDALRELRDKYGYDLNELLVELNKRSEAMWGYDPAAVMTLDFTRWSLIGASELSTSVIPEDDFQKVLGPMAQFVSTHDKNRIAVQKLEFPAPAFGVHNVKDYRVKYLDDQAAFDFHVDANWEKKMQEEGFDIIPTEEHGDSILVWALGFVFGFIKREPYDYVLFSPQRGAVIDKKWYNLGKGKDRAEAYVEFGKQKFVKELSELLEKKFKEIGATEVGRILGEIRQKPNVYYDKYSCIGLERATLDQRGYEAIKRQIEAEMKAVSECDERELAQI